MTDTKARRGTWRSWSGLSRCVPRHWVKVRSEQDVVDAVRTAAAQGLTVRAAGTGHSFNGCACTDGVLVDLSEYGGVTHVDTQARTVTVRTGTHTGKLCAVLHEHGLAIANMGTSVEQTVGGMVATANHGTGIGHPPLTAQVESLRIVTADGVVRDCDAYRDPDLFRAALGGLGTLGVITSVTLRCVPQFKLLAVEDSEPVGHLLDRFDEWVYGSDRASFSVKAWSDTAYTLALHVTDRPPTPNAERRRRVNTLQDVRSSLVGQAGRVSKAAVPWLVSRINIGGDPVEYVHYSHLALTWPQPIRFLSMEYGHPIENVVPALRALLPMLRRGGMYSPYSVTVRTSSADVGLLGPAYGRATGYINLTIPRALSYTEVLRTAEAVFLDHDGRPHLGKGHTATADVLAPRYPEWESFQQARARFDPHGMFTTDYVRRVLGPSPDAAFRGDGAPVAARSATEQIERSRP
jgi:L-gulonolactone oxidase